VPVGLYPGDKAKAIAIAAADLTVTTDDFNVSLTPDSSGVSALHYLRDPARSLEDADELLIQASTVEIADAYTGAALRALIESHLARGRKRHVCLWLPKGPAADLVADLVGSLRERFVIPDDTPRPLRDRNVLVPGMVIGDMDQANAAALFLRMAAPRVAIRPAVANVLAQALLAFSENGLAYAETSACRVVVCAAIDRRTKRVTVAAVDQGQTVCRSKQPLERLKEALDTSASKFGGLTNVRELAHGAEAEATLTLCSGSARIRRPGETRADAAYLPGWCAALTVRLPGATRQRSG